MRESTESWQKILARGFNTAASLLEFLGLPKELGDTSAEQQFKSRVPYGFALRMQRENPADPLLLQVLAQRAELNTDSAYTADPLQEQSANPIPGLIHKYQGRVLLTLTGACAINCRYCFRRHFPYQENNPGREGWQIAVDYIKNNQQIHEVILSGGDPMLASNEVFERLLTQLENIDHVDTLRIHSRIPVVLPERFDDIWLKRLQSSRLKKVMVLHCNHVQELDDSVAKACQNLKAHGFYLLNQSVLLANINDNAQILADLSRRLFAFGVLPYYLHVLDKVAGAIHFDMPQAHALAIYHELQSLLPGYLVPKLAREEAGKAHKTLIR